MAAYFLDSSALAKLYVAEAGSPWLVTLVGDGSENQFSIVRISVVEVAAALFRRVRGQTLLIGLAQTAATRLRHDAATLFEIVEIGPALSEFSIEIGERHGLRGYDCVQLAAALSVQRARISLTLEPLVLISADRDLNFAAEVEGLTVVDPNEH